MLYRRVKQRVSCSFKANKWTVCWWEQTELGDNTKDASKALQKADECGSCYGATALREDGCCNSCQDVRDAYIKMKWGKIEPKDIEQCVREGWLDKFENQSNEGCHIKGKLLVNKVRGNFHIAPGDLFESHSMHIHDLKQFISGAPDGHAFDLSHTIHKLKFGPDSDNEAESILAVTNALGGTNKKANQGETTNQLFIVFIYL